MNLLRTEPVRLYATAAALAALGTYFVPSGAWPLVLGVIAALLGTGQQVRNRVWSAESHQQEVDHALLLGRLPEPTGDDGRADLVTVLVVVVLVLALLWFLGIQVRVN